MSEDRWTYPPEGDDPRDIDREGVDPEATEEAREARQVTHDQEQERRQGTSADAPGVDPADREVDEGGQPTFE